MCSAQKRQRENRTFKILVYSFWHYLERHSTVFYAIFKFSHLMIIIHVIPYLTVKYGLIYIVIET